MVNKQSAAMETASTQATVRLTMMPTQWGSLQDIDDVEPVNPSDYACLAEVREVLKKHGKSARFGISLLHKHFDIGNDEVLLENTDRETRVQTVRPTLKTEVGRTIETQWVLGEEGVTCVQHCPYDGNLEEKHRYK
jgi:hypothetical protein